MKLFLLVATALALLVGSHAVVAQDKDDDLCRPYPAIIWSAGASTSHHVGFVTTRTASGGPLKALKVAEGDGKLNPDGNFRIVDVGNGEVQICLMFFPEWCIVADTSSGGLNVLKNSNGQKNFKIIELPGEDGLVNICAVHADLCWHDYGGTKNGASTRLHNGQDYARQRKNSKYFIDTVGM